MKKTGLTGKAGGMPHNVKPKKFENYSVSIKFTFIEHHLLPTASKMSFIRLPEKLK